MNIHKKKKTYKGRNMDKYYIKRKKQKRDEEKKKSERCMSCFIQIDI